MNKKNELILEVHNLEKTYISSFGIKCTAVKDISLKIDKREILFITGPSGAGKSTLLNLLGGLDRPTQGSVRLNNRLMPYDKEDIIAQIRSEKFGFIFQFHHLLPEFTVMENLLIPGRISGKFSNKELEDHCIFLLNEVGMKHKSRNFPRELSGGEKQRVAVIRALVNKPLVIFADEPTGNLDNDNRDSVYNILKNMIYYFGSTLVLVSHDENVPFENYRKIKLIDGCISK
ncbi:ABC transporter ATP-binding protein [bacterium]